MKKNELEKELSEKLADLPWAFNLSESGSEVKLTNIKINSTEEKEFLNGLEKEGSEQVLEIEGKVPYLITRKNDKLFINLTNEDKEEVTEPNEITEHQALEVFREYNKETNSFNLFGLFGGDNEEKEMTPNQLTLKTKLIKKIELKRTRESNSLKITHKNFDVELKENGGYELKNTKN